MPTLAGTIITRLRAKLPDSVFVADTPQPTMDGKFRVQTLYAWLDDAQRELTQKTGWGLEDWFAIQQVERQPWYAVDEKWVAMDAAFSNQFRLDTVSLTENDVIWPNSQGPMRTQPLSAMVRGLGVRLEVALWPVPEHSDPTTTLVSALAVSGVDPIPVTSTTGFLTYGYVGIDDEIIQYQERSSGPDSIGVISRGVCGTTAATHLAGAAVHHLGFWIKGERQPAAISTAESPVEVPTSWQPHLETYVLAQCRIAQKGRAQEGAMLLAAFERACQGINADPNWKVNVGRIRAFGERSLGPIYPYGQGVIVP